MGKAKKRIFNKGNENIGTVVKRSDAICSIVNSLENGDISTDIKNNISLFGITAEELLEAGASLEEISVLKNIIN